MGGNEDFNEVNKPTETTERSESSGLSTYALERPQNAAQLAGERQQDTAQLVKDNMLPDLELMGDLDKFAQAQEQTTTYDNGVRTTRSEGRTETTEDGRTITIEPSIMVDVSRVQPQPVHQELDKDGQPTGTILDGQNRPVARNNDDGSVSIIERDAQGRANTTTEYPSGVKITTGEPRTETRNGRTITTESNMVIVPEGWTQAQDGSFRGPDNQSIRTNDDGSITYTTKDGTSHTQRQNGQRTTAAPARR